MGCRMLTDVRTRERGLRLTIALPPCAQVLRRQLLRLLHVREFGVEAEFREPCLAFTLPDVICGWVPQDGVSQSLFLPLKGAVRKDHPPAHQLAHSCSFCNDCRDLDLTRDGELARQAAEGGWSCRACNQRYHMQVRLPSDWAEMV